MFNAFTQSFGLHPLGAFAAVALDMMLFGGEAATLGMSLPISGAAGLGVGVGIALLQHFAYGDNLGTALGKGIIVGTLTAIPTPIPAVVTATAGAIGLVHKSR